MTILATAVLSTSMAAPLFALLMLKIAPRVPDDDTLEYLTVQMYSGVFVELDPRVLQYRDNTLAILIPAMLPNTLTAPLFAALALKFASSSAR